MDAAVAAAGARPPASVVASIHGAVQAKRVAGDPRALVTELRAASAYLPCNGLLPALLGALRQLRARATAGEENKGVRAALAYVSALGAQGALSDEDARTVVQQLLAVDVKDGSHAPRQLAALQLAAELAARHPGCDRESRAARGGANRPPRRASPRETQTRTAPTTAAAPCVSRGAAELPSHAALLHPPTRPLTPALSRMRCSCVRAARGRRAAPRAQRAGSPRRL